MDPQPPQTPKTPQSSAEHLATPSQRPKEDHPTHYLSSLLQGVTEWPHNDEALGEALKLRQEQERTKQEYYRLENRKRTLEILTMATRAGIPGAAIPALFDAQPAQRAAAVAAASSAATVGQGPGARAARDSPEVINYEDAQRSSPTRFRATHIRSASAVPTFSARPVTQAYYARQMPAQGSSLQFHHWKPNQRSDEKKKIERSPKQVKPESSLHQSNSSQAPRPVQPQQPQSHSQQNPKQQQQQPPQSPSPGAAVVAAAHQQQQRHKQHSRHRSEAAIPSGRNWYTSHRAEEGASILASLATERNKHDVGYILAPDRSPAHKLQSSPIPTTQTLNAPPLSMGHPGPLSTNHELKSPPAEPSSSSGTAGSDPKGKRE